MAQISSETMINFTTNMLSLLLLIVSASLAVIINSINPLKFEIYPNYLWLYVFHHYSPTLVLGSTVLIYFAKNPQLRTHVWTGFSNRQ